MTPYNTGRVQIGRCYTLPPNRIEGDAIMIQSLLLKRLNSRPPIWLFALVYAAALTAVFIVSIA